MESKIESVVTVTLVINRTEAEYINRLVQNCPYGVETDEPEEEKAMRVAFFNATKLPNKIGFSNA